MYSDKVRKRLMPLYVAGFFQGAVFWYAIEKVFMVHLGFNVTTIAIAVVVLNVSNLLLNTPSGLIADRWSRKNMLIIAYAALGSASLLMGLAKSVVWYIFVTILYGVYLALQSGINDAMIYDVVIEEQSGRENYEKYLGYSHLSAGAALVVSSLLGGLIGYKLGLHAPISIAFQAL